MQSLGLYKYTIGTKVHMQSLYMYYSVHVATCILNTTAIHVLTAGLYVAVIHIMGNEYYSNYIQCQFLQLVLYNYFMNAMNNK